MQPMLAWSLDHSAHLQAQVEVRPRGKGEGARQRGELQRVFHRQADRASRTLRRPWGLGA